MRQLLFFAFILTSLRLLGQAPVPVHEEPRHKPVFANEEIRVLNVNLPPGDTSLYHIHSTPSVFIPFTVTRSGANKLNEKPVESTIRAGAVWFENLTPPGIKIHRVWNEDVSTFHVMDIELLKTDSSRSLPVLQIANSELAVDTPWVKVYKFGLASGQTISLSPGTTDGLLISLHPSRFLFAKDAVSDEKEATEGSYYFLSAGHHYNIGNPTSDMQLVLLQLTTREQ